MEIAEEKQPTHTPPPIFVVSGGQGISGGQIVRTVLAQFQDTDMPVVIVPGVRQEAQIEEVVSRAAASQGTIVHTLVDAAMRDTLIHRAREKNVVAIDLMGQLLSRLATVLGREPLGQPGLYRQVHAAYFERVEAIEFTVAHDDGRNSDELGLADIVLAGVSRVGKTPLSIYLSVLGWKVANVPLIREIPPPPQLFEIDSRRVVGLTVEPRELIMHRRWRERHLGIPTELGYAMPSDLHRELDAAQQIFRQGNFPVLDVTGKPIEESANEVIALVTRRLKDEPA